MAYNKQIILFVTKHKTVKFRSYPNNDHFKNNIPWKFNVNLSLMFIFRNSLNAKSLVSCFSRPVQVSNCKHQFDLSEALHTSFHRYLLDNHIN